MSGDGADATMPPYAANDCTETCEAKRAHVCERCRQPRRTFSFPTQGQVAGSGTFSAKLGPLAFRLDPFLT